MSEKDFAVAKLTEGEMQKLQELEEEFSEDRDRRVALVAYESEKEFALADLSTEDEKKLEDLEQEFARKRDGDVAVVVYESK